MDIEAIATLLEQKIGLNGKSLGDRTLAKAIERRMSLNGNLNFTAYLSLLQTSEAEFNELIELIVVPETWFFREQEAFRYLTRYIQSHWLTQAKPSILRILSLPCCTGEEPYSIAITLLEAGLLPHQFGIDAIDISHQALAKAQKAIYQQNSFRNPETDFRNRYFRRLETGYQLHPEIRQTVNFIPGNLLNPSWFDHKLPYQVIFCRNVLIYLTQTARDRAIMLLDQALASQGLLFLGCSEAGQKLPPSFIPTAHSLSFGYQKMPTLLPASSLGKSSLPTPAQPVSNGKATSSIRQNSTPQIPVKSPELRKPNPGLSVRLEATQTSLNTNSLAEAIAQCQQDIRQNPTHADAYVRLGQLYQKAGHESQAEQALRRALYLNPQHYQALMTLAQVREQKGDRQGAAILKQRIQRLNS